MGFTPRTAKYVGFFFFISCFPVPLEALPELALRSMHKIGAEVLMPCYVGILFRLIVAMSFHLSICQAHARELPTMRLSRAADWMASTAGCVSLRSTEIA